MCDRPESVKKGELDPFAVAVMAELGQNISQHKPMMFEELVTIGKASTSISSSRWRRRRITRRWTCTRTLAAEVEYWPTPDPTGLEGSREQKLEASSRGLRWLAVAHSQAVFEGPGAAMANAGARPTG